MRPSKPRDGPDNVVPIDTGGGPPGGRGADPGTTALVAWGGCGCLIGVVINFAAWALLFWLVL